MEESAQAASNGFGNSAVEGKVDLGEEPQSSRSTDSLGSVVVPLSSNAVNPSVNSSSGSSSHRYQHLFSRLPNPPSLIEFENMRFLVMDAPSESNIDLYLKEMERYGVTDVVRVCDPTYSKEMVERRGIHVHDWIFPDGEGAPEHIIGIWLNLVNERFGNCLQDGGSSREQAIAVHCVAGLGRAPVLVAIALIEAGMSPLDAVTYIREKRRGAINNKQLKYLESYKPRSQSGSLKCCIM